MNCPYCGLHFKILIANKNEDIPDLAPMVCERCSDVSLLVRGVPRKVSSEELEALKKSPAWSFIEAAQRVIARGKQAANARNN